MRHSFLCDDRAISPVIGFALVLAILVSTLGYMQTHFVPVWNAEFESGHFEDVFLDLELFSSNLESAAISGIPRTSPVKLGLVYPKRGIFYNPKPVLFGSLAVKPDVYVNITYTTVFNVTTKSYRSSSLKYELPGNHPFLVYEHGIVIRDFSNFGRGNATASGNTMIVGDNINIPLVIINGSTGFGATSVSSQILSIYPIEITEKKNIVNYLKYVNITMDTHYPEVWRHVFRFANTSNTNITVAGSNGPGKVYINTTAGNEIDLPDETQQVTQEGRLYGGMALVKTTAALQSYTGVGQESMGMGSLWKDVPPPNEISQFILTNITQDVAGASGCGAQCTLQNDIIAFKVADYNGKFWIVTLNFNNNPDTITSIVGRTSLGSETNSTSISLNNATKIDLLRTFSANGRYNVSNISQPNSLVSIWMGDSQSFTPDKSPLINYQLIIQ